MELTSPAAAATLVRLRARFGASADTWWAELPAQLAALSERWDLHLGEPVGSGNTSLVVRCRAAGAPAMLKLTPDPEIAAAERAALELWAPTGRVPTVQAGAPGALLLEAMSTETPLSETLGAPTPPESVLDEVAALMRTLHEQVPAARAASVHAFAPQADRLDRLFRLWTARAAGDPHRVAALERGHALARELATAPPRRVLVHGDLHPGNVLADAARGLVAIDPRPGPADPASDAIDWVVLGEPGRWRPTADRLAGLIDVDGDRLWAWCRALAARLADTETDPSRRQAFRAMAV